MKSPCVDCKDRHVGCHSGCEKEEAYLAAKKTKQDAAYAELRKDMALTSFRNDMIRKTKRRRKQ